MILIIDAYNVLKRESAQRIVSARERNRFAAEVAAYAQSKGHEALIVFDGYEPDDATVAPKPVRVVFAGAGGSADAYIKKMLDRMRPETALLVSSDTELGVYASRLGIVTMPAELFGGLLERKNTVPDARVIIDETAEAPRPGESEVDALMRKASRVILVKDVDGGDEPTRRSSKLEKKVLKIVKKL